ncbi:FixH family protein [Marinobacter caseinilyticus]|uniref:FixH family protein n=1 Tax=Marinobacter caseinilyticus TaxID=2692195 RepID=UPI001F19EA6D|nr:FixH family protein [Marinobacter caseinilyticus]
MMINEEKMVAPWFRQPWFWFLLIFPGMSVIWCTLAITVAVTTDNAMVTDDYSKEGRGINAEFARDDQASAMGLSARLDFSGERLMLTMDSTSGDQQFPYLILNLFHPTLSERDRTIQLNPTDDGRYSAALPRNLDGRWYFDLRDPGNQWRLKGETHLPSLTPLEIHAEVRGRE